MNITIRKGTREELPAILALIRELAAYERAPQEVTVTPEELERDGFGDQPLYEVIVAVADGAVAGMALYYPRYSTWKGRCMYLEDIIVSERYRGRGVGFKLFEAVIGASRDFGARRLEWQVLEWNEPAISFYRKFNAVLDAEWVNGKLTEEQIRSWKVEKSDS